MLYMFVIFRFVYVHMKCSRSIILIPFSINVALFKIMCLLFTIASTSRYSISINLCCAFAIVYNFVVYCTFNYTYVYSCSSCTIMFSSLMSFYTTVPPRSFHTNINYFRGIVKKKIF